MATIAMQHSHGNHKATYTAAAVDKQINEGETYQNMYLITVIIPLSVSHAIMCLKPFNITHRKAIKCAIGD